MDYVGAFKQFWNEKGQYLGLNNPSRTYEDISSALLECNDHFDIDDYVCRLPSRKETNRKIIVAFYDYLQEKNANKIDSILYDKKFYDYPFERQLEIAKYLHEPHTLDEIEEYFDISDETRKKDIRALEEGIEVLGAKVSIKKERKDRKDYYRTTMHPIFLPLNLTEVYALTTYLEQRLDPTDINSKIIYNISARIKSQLSDYAFNKLFPNERREIIENSYVDDESLATQREGIRMYLMKSGQLCKFFWKGKEYTGRIIVGGRREYIELESGEKIDADPKEVDFFIDSLNYK